jgi:signal transduction histidine kinase
MFLGANPEVAPHPRCQDEVVTATSRQPRWPEAAAGLACVTCVAALVGLLVADRRLVAIGRPDLVGLHGETWILVGAMVSALAVGTLLAMSKPRHPVGWLFMALSGSMLASGLIDEYTVFTLDAGRGSEYAGRVAAVIGDSSFIPWLVIVAFVLHLTPTGSMLGRRWALAAWATALSGAVCLAAALISPRTLSAPHEGVANPWAVPEVAAVTDPIVAVAILVVGAGLVVAGASLFVRFRRARGADRQQLLWLALVVVPLPLFVVVAFVASRSGNASLTIWATGGFVVLVPAAAGLSIIRFQLYDVERVMARAVTYGLLSALLVATYAIVVLVATRGVGAWSGSPEVSATLAAVSAAALVAPLRAGLQDMIDRRFNRRRHDAIRLVRAGLADERAGVDVQTLFRRAFGDESVAVAYPAEEPGTWLTAEGHLPAPSAAHVDVRNHGRVVARVGYDPSLNEAETIAGAVSVAAAELDNARLRAELSLQVAEISASRQRIAHAQRAERRRIERDLHDGAQQMLLALAFDLQAAQLNGDESRLRQALAEGVNAARDAVQELRELANGLHPTALADGGLSAALDDLARHSSTPLRIRSEVPRLDAGLEFTAWLVACEAVVNAQRHAHASGIEVVVAMEGDTLLLRVSDDGMGGANPEGTGLRGLRDRTEAARGTFALASEPGMGTMVAVSLPCGS